MTDPRNDDLPRRTAIVRPNGVTSAYGYDAASQVTAITHTGPSSTLMSFAYTYDAAGNRTSVTKDGGNPETYTLDALNRLTSVTYADGTTQAYTYDATGNPLRFRRLPRLRARLAR
jgi:YD repeat-containing protein